MTVYVLQLKGGKVYVGYTGRGDVMERIREHETGCGSEWTKLHPVSKILHIYPGKDEDDENEITLDCMRTFGWENVRGGKYCQIVMKNPPSLLQSEENCKVTTFCSRCGRTSHQIEACFAKTNVKGQPLSPPKAKSCYVCGKEGHFAKHCAEKQRLDGPATLSNSSPSTVYRKPDRFCLMQ